MIDNLDKAGPGRAAEASARLTFNTAFEKWRDPATEDKKKAALAVLANVGALGQKLANLVSEEDAIAIRRDAGLL